MGFFNNLVVPQALIEMLMARVGPGGIHTLPDKALQPGERVRIRAGVMEGYEAVLLTKSARDRVILLLDTLGKQIRVEVEAGHVEASN